MCLKTPNCNFVGVEFSSSLSVYSTNITPISYDSINQSISLISSSTFRPHRCTVFTLLASQKHCFTLIWPHRNTVFARIYTIFWRYTDFFQKLWFHIMFITSWYTVFELRGFNLAQNPRSLRSCCTNSCFDMPFFPIIFYFLGSFGRRRPHNPQDCLKPWSRLNNFSFIGIDSNEKGKSSNNNPTKSINKGSSFHNVLSTIDKNKIQSISIKSNC